jgi:hypothetical protein
MIYLTVGSLIFGVLGVAFGLRCYRELWKWARQCQHARIVVAYKRKVKLNAPLVEWLLWCNNLDKDKDANGRVIYTVGGTTVALIKKSFVPRRQVLRGIAGARSRRRASAAPQQPQMGGFAVRDDTVKK